jgi:hypothetical protein
VIIYDPEYNEISSELENKLYDGMHTLNKYLGVRIPSDVLRCSAWVSIVVYSGLCLSTLLRAKGYGSLLDNVFDDCYECLPTSLREIVGQWVRMIENDPLNQGAIECLRNPPDDIAIVLTNLFRSSSAWLQGIFETIDYNVCIT